MGALLRLSNAIDRLNELVGRWLSWLILAAVLISAVTRSFAGLQLQLELVPRDPVVPVRGGVPAGCGLHAAAHEHVKIDVVLGRFSKRTQIIVEAVCLVLFLAPFCIVVIELVWPLVVRAYNSGEMSSNAGGLIRWPV